MAFLFLTLCFAALYVLASPIQVKGARYLLVHGMVFDGAGYPMSGVHVVFWNPEVRFMAETNASGRYETSILGWKSYQVYAYYNDVSTSGFDYIPAYRHVLVRDTPINMSFTLLPGASINIEGNLRSFENRQPPTNIVFTVLDQNGLLEQTGCVTIYAEDLLVNQLLNLSKTVIAPSGIPFKIDASINYSGEIEHHYTIDREGDYLNVAQGQLLNIDLTGYAARGDIEICHGYVTSALSLVNEAESVGFYVSYERNELLRAEKFVEAANSATAKGAYEEAQANLRQAYLITRSVEEAIPSLYVNASKSVVFVTPFLGFTAAAVASILTEDRRRRVTISLALYGVLFGLLYLLYPGYAALQKTIYNLWASTAVGLLLITLLVCVSFLVAHLAIFVLPYAFKERTRMEEISHLSAVVTAFAMSGRNLRRRRLRTLLMLATLFASVFAFTTLTSFSYEHGFFIQPKLGPAGPTEGLLIRTPGEYMPFEPISPLVVDWLQKHPEVAVVTPKLENIPQEYPLGWIKARTGNIYRPVYGALGVFPSLEAKVTKIDRIVVEGRFLRDDDRDGILISRETAEMLRVGVNDTLQLHLVVNNTLQLSHNFILTGIFDDEGFEGLRDLDGAPVAPQMIVPMVPFVHCPSFWVVIMHQETAREFPWMIMSRVDVQTLSPSDIIPTARLAVLQWEGIQAFATVAGRVHRLSIGSYYITSGFASAMIPLGLVVLNVAALMIGVVYERRREVVIMSSLGLNPSHISALFVAEALVIGVIAGSLGYLLGLTSYRFMTLLPISPLLKQKVEVGWGILALGLSIAAAVLGSALPATRASIIVTPSLIRKRKYRVGEEAQIKGDAWITDMPIQIHEEDLGRFFGFMESLLREYTSYHIIEGVANLKVSREVEVRPESVRLSFVYYRSEEGLVTENQLLPEKSRIPNLFNIKLCSRTPQGTMRTRSEHAVKQTVSFIHRLLLQYSQKQKA